MSVQHFRSALGGFNREDVVHYIEFMNNQYKSQIDQLNNQLKEARERMPDEDMATRLAEAEARCEELMSRCAALEQDLAAEREKTESLEQEVQEAKTAAAAQSHAEELEAYRRAERVERLAAERSQQVYDKANGVIADASCKVEEAAAHIGAAAGQMQQYLQSYMVSVDQAKEILQQAKSSLQAIRPEEQ